MRLLAFCCALGCYLFIGAIFIVGLVLGLAGHRYSTTITSGIMLGIWGIFGSIVFIVICMYVDSMAGCNKKTVDNDDDSVLPLFFTSDE